MIPLSTSLNLGSGLVDSLQNFAFGLLRKKYLVHNTLPSSYQALISGYLFILSIITPCSHFSYAGFLAGPQTSQECSFKAFALALPLPVLFPPDICMVYPLPSFIFPFTSTLFYFCSNRTTDIWLGMWPLAKKVYFPILPC